CPAPPPKPENITYFPSAAAAVKAGLRPCLRCRPEAAPGTPAWNGTSATVARAMHLIRRGALNEGGVEALAHRLGIGSRHLRRLFKRQLGTTPMAMASLQRVFFAKQLLRETLLPVTEIAYACGFGSIRRFNAAFRTVCGRSPTESRLASAGLPKGVEGDARFTCRLTLPYRPPFLWPPMLAFFRERALSGIEAVDEHSYQRTFRCNGHSGFFRVSPAPKVHGLVLEVRLSDMRNLMGVVERARRMFDLDANLEAITRALSRDPLLRPLIKKLPGLRLPVVWDPFEAAVRAVVGQQISIQGARTILGRIVRCAGPLADYGHSPDGALHLFPNASELAGTDLSGVGLTASRIRTLKELARGVAAGRIELAITRDLPDFIRRMTDIAGIGPWTAHYTALRALGEPDAFPASDLGLARAMTQNGRRPTRAQVRARAENWRPWRAYGATYLWNA
ncbi:MAG: AlkA N-terminal domain-containing protein, partial [Desulfobacterales bacterium]